MMYPQVGYLTRAVYKSAQYVNIIILIIYENVYLSKAMTNRIMYLYISPSSAEYLFKSSTSS